MLDDFFKQETKIQREMYVLFLLEKKVLCINLEILLEKRVYDSALVKEPEKSFIYPSLKIVF